MNKEENKHHLVVSETADPDWPLWLESLNGNIYHSKEWAEIQGSATSRPLFFHWRNEADSVIAIAVGIESWSGIPLLGRHSKRLEFETYPATKSSLEGLINDLLPQLLEYAQKSGHSLLKVQSYYADSVVPQVGQLGFLTEDRLEFVIDLALPEELLWKNLSGTHRRKIGKARKYELKLETADDLEGMRKFRKLQVQSRDRRLDRGEDIGSIEDAYYEKLGQAYFDRNLGRVYFLTLEGIPVSGAFVSVYAKKAYYVYGGSSDEGFQMNAPALLFWEMFANCRENGCAEFNLGGVPALAADKEAQSHGLYRFKSGFGGREVPCVSLTVGNLQPGKDRLIGLAKRILGGR